jgi:hypothetical protein
VDLAHKLKLKALDLMHIAYTTNLASKGLANTIVTLDKEIKEKEPLKILSTKNHNTQPPHQQYT